jgi:hypothetical protein
MRKEELIAENAALRAHIAGLSAKNAEHRFAIAIQFMYWMALKDALDSLKHLRLISLYRLLKTHHDNFDLAWRVAHGDIYHSPRRA